MQKKQQFKNMVDKKYFFTLIEDHLNFQNKVDIISDAGLQIFDSPIVEYGNSIFNQLLKALFHPEGVDWIEWWLYEKNGDSELKVWNEYGDEIPSTTKEDLWELIKNYIKE